MISLWSNARLLRKSSQLVKYSFENINDCNHQKAIQITPIFRKTNFDVKIKVGKLDHCCLTQVELFRTFLTYER